MITLLKEHRRSILRIVSIYSFILLFPAFGPGLHAIVGPSPIGIYSAVFLLFLAVGLVFEYKLVVKVRLFFEALVVLITIAFYWSTPTLRLVELAILGLLLARLILDWIYSAYNIFHEINIGYYFGMILALSYGVLYLGNVFIPMIPVITTYIIISLISIVILFNWESGRCKVATDVIKRDQHLPMLGIVVLIIYVSAGTTYNSIYPALTVYANYEQFYNVLPFVPVALMAGYLLDKHTFNLLYIGIIFLGLAVISIFIISGPIQYFTLQTFIQIAWALLDLFAWVAGARYAMAHNNPRILAFFVAAFLFGTTAGSFLTELVGGNILEAFEFQHALITLLPLFASLLIIGLFRLFDSDIIVDHILKRQRILESDELTSREREIAMHLIHNYTYQEISDALDISINTLKTHIKNIYRKLGINNKDQLGIEK